MRLAAAIVLAAALCGACRGPEDHRADTTVGPTPVGRADLRSVPPRPTRTPRPDIPFWTPEDADRVAARVPTEPLPVGARPLGRPADGRATVFWKEQEAGLHWICPRRTSWYAVTDAAAFRDHVRRAAETAGYRTAEYRVLPPDPIYQFTVVFSARAPDGAADLTLGVQRGDPLEQSEPYRATVELVQRCEG